MSEWERTTLGACFDVVKSKARPEMLDPEYPYVGMEHIIPDTAKVLTTGKIGDVNSQVGLFQQGDVLFGRLRAYLRKVTIADHDGAASTEVLILRPRRAVIDPPFLYLIASSEACIDHAVTMSAGSRMPRTSASDLSAFPIALPPPQEQHRIADLMAAMDAQIGALMEEIVRARTTLFSLNSALIEGLSEWRTLGDFTSTRSGPSYAAADAASTSSKASVPVIGIPNTKPDGSVDLSEISHVVGLPDRVAKIDESSLVLIRTNGNRQRIGNVYMPPAAAHEHAVSAFQFLMKVDDPADREFVYWLLREPSMQASMSDAASGTTGLGNLAVRWLNAVQVPWSPDPVDRAAVVAPLRSLQNTIDASGEELARLQTVRSSLLSGLLNQEIELPESYDALLEKVT